MLELLHPASLSIVCFRVNPGGLDEATLEVLNRHVLAMVFWDGHSFIPSTTLREAFALRLCIVNPTTTSTDVRETLDRVVRIGGDWLRNNDRGKAHASQGSGANP